MPFVDRQMDDGPVPPAKVPISRKVAVAPAAILALFLAIILFGPQIRPADTRLYSSELRSETGYKEVTDRLAQLGLLKIDVTSRAAQRLPDQRVVKLDTARLDRMLAESPEIFGNCSNLLPRLPLIGGLETPTEMVGKPAACKWLIEKYQRTSVLGDHMSDASESRWLLDSDVNGKEVIAGLRSNALVVNASGMKAEQWTGMIEYAGQDKPAPKVALVDISSGDMAVAFAPLRQGDNRKVKLNAPQWFNGEAATSGARKLIIDLSAQKSISEAIPIVILQRLMNGIVMQTSFVPSSIRIVRDGELLDTSGEETKVFLLQPGQYLGITDASGENRRILQVVEVPTELSVMANNVRVRAGTLDKILRQMESSGYRANVTSSIRYSLQAPLENTLGRYVAKSAGLAANGRISGPTTPRAAALLFDGITGEIAAAGSFPSKISHLTSAANGGDRRAGWLNTNFNFENLPIGSTAKIPFAAAVVQQHPELLDKEPIPYVSTFTWVSDDGSQRPGMTNAPGASNGRVGFVDAIAYSNNQYALTLVQRARQRERDAREDDESVIAYNKGDGWQTRFWNLSCAMIFKRDKWLEDTNCSHNLWRSEMNEPLGINPVEMPVLNLNMRSLSEPEAGKKPFKDKKQLNDYEVFYQNVLGGGQSRWTTINLAQAYARIIGGRNVNPRMTVADPAAKYPVSNNALTGAAWSKITEGMMGTLSYGTASKFKLANIIRADDSQPLFLYAKTGTPDIQAYSDMGQSIGQKKGHLIVLAVARTRSGSAPKAAADICALKILVINFQQQPMNGGAFAAELLGDSSNAKILSWLTQPCRSEKL